MSTTVTPAPLHKELHLPAKWNLGIGPITLLLACGALAVFFLALVHHLKWTAAGLAVSPTTVVTIMSPLVLASAFIERAVEIVISPWRDGRSAVLQKRWNALQSTAIPADPEAAVQLQQNADEAATEFQAYKSQTQQLAFCVSIAMSLCAALVGVRCLEPFLPTNAMVSDAQLLWLRVFDVALTACLLAGGADGIHSAVNMVTNFFQTTAQNTSSGNGAGN